MDNVYYLFILGYYNKEKCNNNLKINALKIKKVN